jgi:hypothetical protein
VLIYKKIKSIEYVGEGDIYDIEVPQTNNYIAQGFVNHNSGKDVVISTQIILNIVWLLHLKNPQKYLGIKDGEPIDIVNIAFDADCATSVFFEKLKRLVRETKNPATGQNFFEEQGMDINKAVQENKILFPKNIRAFSANSTKYKLEGKNIVLAVFDEIAQFRFDRAEAIRKHIKSSAKPTCPKYYKLFYISFLTSGNDYMAHLLDMSEKGDGKMYYDRSATWEVRSEINCPEELKPYIVKKSEFGDEYDEDPETAMLMYECKIPKVFANSFIRQPQRILDCIGKIDDETFRSSPIIEPENIWSYNPLEEEFEPWFKPYTTELIWKLQQEYEKNPSNALEEKIKFEKDLHSNGEYYVHLDLSRGVVDCGGLVLGHKYRVLDQNKLYIDLMLQIRADKTIDKNAEIDMTQLLDFVIKVLKNKLKFPISNLSADGWNSALFFNICEKENIPCELVSLEKNNIPYETLKTFIYSGNINFYPYQVAIRELTELIIENKKVNHPRKSQWRMKEEGLPLGSKEISDSLSGVAYSSTKDDDEGGLSYAST